MKNVLRGGHGFGTDPDGKAYDYEPEPPMDNDDDVALDDAMETVAQYRRATQPQHKQPQPQPRRTTMAFKPPNPKGNSPMFSVFAALSVIVGDTKVGKTTFAASAGPSMLILDFEGSARLIPGCHAAEINSQSDLKEAFEYLEAGDHPYKTVAVDSVTALISLIERDVVETFRPTRKPKQGPLHTLADVEFGQGYKRASVKVASIINRFHALQKKGIGTLLICHTELRTTTTKNGDEEVKEVPNLSKHYQYAVLGRADAVLHIRNEVERDGSVERVIYTQPDLFSGSIGCRFPGLPKQLPEPTWDAYSKTVKAGATALKKTLAKTKQPTVGKKKPATVTPDGGGADKSETPSTATNDPTDTTKQPTPTTEGNNNA